MAVLKQSTSYKRSFKMVQSSDHRTPLTGATVTVTLSKAGAAFGAATGAVSEIGLGWYSIFLTTTDVSVLGNLVFHCTATSGDATDWDDDVQSRLPADVQINASGQALIASNLKQSQDLNGFTFVMTDATSHTPATGKTVTAQRSLAGAGFAPCANAASEVSNGLYKINLAASDLASPVVTLRFTATACDDSVMTLILQP